MKYSYSTDGEIYHGEFDTPEAAAAELGSRAGWVGENRPPTPPEDYWDVDDWIEHVSCQDDYSSDAADDWFHASREVKDQINRKVRSLLAWLLDRHKLRPQFLCIENARRWDGTQFVGEEQP